MPPTITTQVTGNHRILVLNESFLRCWALNFCRAFLPTFWFPYISFRQVRYFLFFFLLITYNQHTHYNGLVYWAILPSVTVNDIWDNSYWREKPCFGSGSGVSVCDCLAVTLNCGSVSQQEDVVAQTTHFVSEKPKGHEEAGVPLCVMPFRW